MNAIEFLRNIRLLFVDEIASRPPGFLGVDKIASRPLLILCVAKIASPPRNSDFKEINAPAAHPDAHVSV